MQSRFPQAASKLLEQTIATTFKEELQALCVRNVWSDPKRKEELKRASANLDRLQELQSPDYQDYLVALLYLHRYHFSHVNLAWSMLDHAGLGADPSVPRASNRLQIVDFGAGNFALLTGIALHLAELIDKFGSSPFVTVTSVEPALPMRDLGQASWKHFKRTAELHGHNDESVLHPLFLAIKNITHRYGSFEELQPIRPNRKAHRCLTAMHTLYDDRHQKRRVKETLRAIGQSFSPSSGMATCHFGHEDALEEIMPFDLHSTQMRPEPKMSTARLSELIAVGHAMGVVRKGRFEIPPLLAYPTWSKNLEDTRVLLW